MALSLKKIRERAVRIMSLGRLGPKNDIQKDIIEGDNDKKGYHFSSVVGDIKRNWSDIKTFNKKF